jgi:23S rRNA (adenine2503-C2)-methyltransferase
MVRNLTSGEIVSQVMLVKDLHNDYVREEEKRVVGNVVFMGMGEPLQNYREVVKSIFILNHNEGLAISKRKITVSTCGIIPKIEQLAKDIAVNLSISLHSPNNTQRSQIMPINNNYNIEELLEVIKKYYETSNAKKVTLVYIMLKGVNDSDESAHSLAKLAKGLPVKFNLIPFHPYEGCEFESSSNERIAHFADILCSYGFSAPIRTTRGDDIMAACGQLKSSTIRQNKGI